MENIENQILTFTGEITKQTIEVLKNSIIKKRALFKENIESTLLVSLKGTVYKKDPTLFVYLIKEINTISSKINAKICFMDYSVELYSFLKEAAEYTNIKLFKNINIAKLFIYPELYTEEVYVLIYDEDEQTSKDLTFALTKNKYKVDIAKDMKEFLEGMKLDKYDVVVTRSSLNEKEKKSPKVKNKLSLSKQVIVNLPVFMNKAVETLVSFTGLEAKKVSHTIKNFDTSISQDNICAVMAFHGDLEGYFTLVFPKDIAIKALEALLGETVKENDVLTLKDGVGELCNIITGSTKTQFDTKGIKVTFELPKTYDSLQDTKKHIGTNNGIWMDMQLSGKAFYMFITR